MARENNLLPRQTFGRPPGGPGSPDARPPGAPGPGPAPTPTVTLDTLWREVSFTPNAQQRQAILATSGPLYLTAGPGSGKTRVLLWRTLNLIVFHGVAPAEIFLGTFTEKGAHQLREGLRGLLALVTEKTGRPFDISAMSIGTIHSICHRLLGDRRLHTDGRRPRVPAVLDEFAQYLFVYGRRNWERLVAAGELGEDANGTLIEYFTGRTGSSRHDAATSLISFFNRCSEESITPDAAKKTRDPMLRALLAMYAEYRAMLLEDPARPRTDLSLLQEHAYQRLLASPRGTSLFQHVVIDEYQDTNSIQEKIYFHLAAGAKNLCVVGDDDQALYRFRGATVDNFLAFPDRCAELLGAPAQQIPLVTNYRSRAGIVDFYNRFMGEFTWERGRERFRVPKVIQAHSKDRRPAVLAAQPGKPVDVAAEVAAKVRELVAEGRVKDPSDIAFLFPSLRSSAVNHMREALEAEGFKIYAPRANSFIEVTEAKQVFGVLALVFGKPDHPHSGYADWLDRAVAEASALVRADRGLAQFVKDRQEEIEEVVRTERALLGAVKAAGLEADAVYEGRAADVLHRAPGVPDSVRRFLDSRSFHAYLKHQRERRPDRPITLRYVINRACSLDWGVLDLFYQLTAFDAFKAAFDAAERGDDEGPICNLSLVSDYLARFQTDTSPVISAQFLSGQRFVRRLFTSYLYSIYRLGQGEYEDKQDPFPKGRISFLTIHQAKGLEFPVVVLGNLRKDDKGLRKIDQVVAGLVAKKREPLELSAPFDIARMFYVALSRAEQLLVLCPFKGQGQRINEEFQGPMRELAKPLARLDVRTIDPEHGGGQAAVPRPYSFTGDYINYTICPRRYMLYRRYGFAPSRGQTMMFGNLVHGTIEDLHQWIIHQRSGQEVRP